MEQPDMASRPSRLVQATLNAFAHHRQGLDEWQEALNEATLQGHLDTLMTEAHRQLTPEAFEPLYKAAMRMACDSTFEGSQGTGRSTVFGLPVHGRRADLEVLWRQPLLANWLRQSAIVAPESQILAVAVLSCDEAMNLSVDALTDLRKLGERSLRMASRAVLLEQQAWCQKHAPAPTQVTDEAITCVMLGVRVTRASEHDVLQSPASFRDHRHWQGWMQTHISMLDADVFRRVRIHMPAWWEDAVTQALRMRLGNEIDGMHHRMVAANPQGVLGLERAQFEVKLTPNRKNLTTHLHIHPQGHPSQELNWILPLTYADAHGANRFAVRLWQDLHEDNRRFEASLQASQSPSRPPQVLRSSE